jgi:hypothetical protein
MFHPAMLNSSIPITTSGDGNCLYRAVSQSLTGSEKYHDLLRLKTALELILHESYYNKENFIGDIRIITSVFKVLVHDAVVLKSYSEMAHVYALSAAIGRPIRSYYPPQINPEYSSEPHTRRIVGRNVSDTNPNIVIMWTQMKVPVTMNDFRPNHFVPLFNLDLVSETNESVLIEEPDYNTSNSLQSCSDFNITEVSMTHINDDILSVSVDVSLDSPLNKQNPNVHEEGTCAEEETMSIHENSDLEGNSRRDENPEFSDEQHTGTLTGYLDTSDVVNKLLTCKAPLERIPGGKKDNMFFIIDNTRNKVKKEKKKHSRFPDDCGVWDSGSGSSPTTWYMRNGNGDLTLIFLKGGKYCVKRKVKKQIEYVPIDPQPNKEKIVAIQRYYATLKLDPHYRKRVTWLTDKGLSSNCALAEYVGCFPGLGPHGNAKCKTDEYLRTPDYVLEDLGEMVKSDKPKKVYDKMKSKYDEVTRPRSLKQVNDKKHAMLKKERPTALTKNVADQIKVLENKVSDNDKFVRCSVRSGGKTPCLILYTDDQIADIKKFCCSGHTVLGIDKTFNLCDMHVTLSVYKQLTVVKSTTKQNPIFLGPIYIHDNSDFETYCHFFHHLKMKLYDGQSLSKLVIGSDDERAMVNAVTTAFPESTHILCTRHLRQNCNKKLEDDQIGKTDRLDILNRIFGDHGIVDADDTFCFDNLCDDLESRCANLSHKFVDYFHDHLRPQLQSKVNKPTRHDIVEQNWTNNNCESYNHVLKQTTDWKSKSLTDLVDELLLLVEGQFKDIKSAILRTGEFRLVDTHAKFAVTKTEYIAMSNDQRNRLYTRLRNAPFEKPGQITSSDGTSSIIAPKSHGKKPGQRKRKVNAKTTSIKRPRTDDNTDE